MSTEIFNKDNLDNILKELAKEYRKLAGKTMPAEIILIGGAAVIEKYGFRDMTTDIDAIIRAASSMKDAVNNVGNRYNLPRGWLNDDFKKTDSYSMKLSEVSVHYRTFANVLNIRVVSAEYLIAMKLKAGRKYKNDLSDIVGILAEHKKNKEEITLKQIKDAVVKLYGSWDKISKDSADFIENLIDKGNYEKIYDKVLENEKNAKEILVDFNEIYPDVANEENVDNIIYTLKQKSKSNILKELKKKK